MSHAKSLHASEEDWARLHEYADLCREIAATWEAHSRRTRWEVQEGSPFARELESLSRQPSPTNRPWSPEDLHPAPGSAFVYLSVARMHLDALAALLDEGIVMFSLGPIVRSIVEHCARVSWALDPRCAVRERLARAFWVRHDDLHQAARLAKASGSSRDLKTYRDGIKDLRNSWVRDMFWPSEREYDPKNDDLRSVHSQRFPGFSELVSYLSDIHPKSGWDARAAYDFLSALTHPTIHIYRHRTRDRGTDAEDPTEDGIGVVNVRISMEDVSEPRDLTYLATYCFVDMWRLVASYYGLDPDDPAITTLLQRVRDLRLDADDQGDNREI